MTVVGVHPPQELSLKNRLFTALAQAFPVQFEAIDRLVGARVDALVAYTAGPFDEGLDGPPKCFVIDCTVSRSPAKRLVRFTDSPLLDTRLRSRSLCESVLTESALHAREGDHILALADERPIWLKRDTPTVSTDIVSSGPSELTDGEFLKDRLDPGRFFELLALVHFLRELCAASAWTAPPSRAAFIVDDPNLHWHSYGYLQYRELVACAREYGYHAVIAMVPLDGWYAHRSTVRLFRESTDVLSLCAHGNDHRRKDLGRPATRDDARRILAQSVYRIAGFESRTGLAVSRVMVPPHEACSPASMDVMLEAGFEAVSVTRPYPWMPGGEPYSPYHSPRPNELLSGWRITQFVGDGVPVMIRRPIYDHDEIPLRSYLDQPIILYGHVSDFSDGLQPLARAAAIVNSLPSVRWCSLSEIAAGNFESRRRGSTLEIRPFSRRIEVTVEPDVAEITLRLPSGARGFCHGVQATLNGWHQEIPPAEDGTVLLPAHRSVPVTVEIEWRNASHVGSETMPLPRRAVGPLLRRFAVEARDRLAPMLHRRKTGRETHTGPRPPGQ
jgi:hypothetical protein